MGIIAILLVISGSAFIAMHPSHKSPNSTFYYKYNLTTSAGENTPSNYSFISPQPQDDEHVEDCGGSQLPCVIRAQGTMTAPNSSEITPSNLPNVTLTQKQQQ